jgi:hypothetical protein
VPDHQTLRISIAGECVYGRPKHLQRHLCEYDFRYTHRIKLGVDDQMPRDLALDQGQAMDASLA